MSVKYECDRCGRQQTGDDMNHPETASLYPPQGWWQTNHPAKPEKMRLLCTWCKSALEKFLERLPTDAQSDVGWLQSRVRDLETQLVYAPPPGTFGGGGVNGSNHLR